MIFLLREQPHYTNLLTKDFFEEFYISKKMSYPKISAMLKEQGHNIHVGTIFSYAKKLGIGRDASEARRLNDEESLDYSISFLTEDTVEAIDGFLLGDGGIWVKHSIKINATARLKCGVEYEQFAKYLMDHFKCYDPSTSKVISSSMKQGFVWDSYTRFHPDIYQQWLRWYPLGFKKQPPDDVRITPKSAAMWYLGDGSLVQENNTAVIRLSTDGFNPERVEFLSNKLNDIGILCHRNNDNRILIKAKGIPAFFDFIGKTSPIPVYQYKFDLPAWRFESKRMKDVAMELGLDYGCLANWVKREYVPCFRASTGGKPRFLPEHIDAIKEYMKNPVRKRSRGKISINHSIIEAEKETEVITYDAEHSCEKIIDEINTYLSLFGIESEIKNETILVNKTLCILVNHARNHSELVLQGDLAKNIHHDFMMLNNRKNIRTFQFIHMVMQRGNPYALA